MAVEDTLGREVGGLSVGTWAIIGGAGLAIGIAARSLMNRRSAAVTLTAAVPVGYQTQGAVTMNGGPVPEPTTNVETNEAWAREAIAYLIKQGVPPLRADAAIRKYLGGYQELTYEEGQALAIALQWKLPPQGVSAPLVGPAPAPVAPTRPQAPPAKVPQQFTPDQTRWLSDVDSFIRAIKASSSGQRQITDAELRKAASMGIRPPVKELTGAENAMYGAWLRANGFA